MSGQSSFKNKLGQGVTLRLAGGYVVLILVIIVVAVMGMNSVSHMRNKFEVVLDTRIPRLTELQQIQADLANMNTVARDALLSTDAAKIEQSLAAIEAGRTTVGGRLESLQKLLTEEGTEASKQVAQRIGDHSSGILVGLIKFSRFVKADKRDQALALLQESLQDKLVKLAQEISAYQKSQIDSLSAVKEEAAAAQAAETLQATAIAAAAVLAAIFFAVVVVRSVILPLREATAVAEVMAQGDFTHRLTAKSQDEVGAVINAFNKIAEGLTGLVVSIRHSVALVNDTAESITTRNTRLENRAGEQTKALNVAMEFIGNVQGVITQNVTKANQAMSLAGNMAEVAHKSKTSVQDAVTEMNMIKQSSDKITDIISLIDSIAFQTNILALNAAVEAARAGESGRGFAVVAAEVRILAKRSTDASKDIKALINSSQEQVKRGTTKVLSITQVIEQVAQTADGLRGLVEQIASGSEDQGQQMKEMVNSVSELTSGNDNNLHIVGGMRHTTQELREMAHALNQQLAGFKINETNALALEHSA